MLKMEQKTNEADEFKGLTGSLEPSTEYLGIIGNFPAQRIIEERIIAGRKIKAWERDCWPWGMFSDGGGCTEKNRISGSLGFIDFYKIKMGELKTFDLEEGEVIFPYIGSDALNISILGIEPSGITRLRNDTRNWNENPTKLIIKSLIQELENIAKERKIPVITVSTESIYNFYSDNEDISNKLAREIYNSPYYEGKFHQFEAKKKKHWLNRKNRTPLDKVIISPNNSVHALYSIIEK